MENNERKNNNRGMFYAVMGVATLVITMIGATFAYFVATTNSAVNAITAGSTTVSLTFDDNTNKPDKPKTQVLKTSGSTNALHLVTNGSSSSEHFYGLRDMLVPVDTLCDNKGEEESKCISTCSDQNVSDGLCTNDDSIGYNASSNKNFGTLSIFAKNGYSFVDVDDKDEDLDKTETINYQYAGGNRFDCMDANGNSICSVYSFTVTNPANVSQTIYPKFTVKTNGFGNLKYAVFKGTPAQVAASTNGWDVNGVVNASVTTLFGTNAVPNGGVSFDKTIDITNATRKHTIGNAGDLIISSKKVGAANSVESWLASQVNGFQNTETAAITRDWDRLRQILDPNESMTYTMIFWIEETYTNQSDADMTQKFEAGVSFTTEGDNTGVTGSLLIA